MDAIADFDAYPDWVREVSRAEVHEWDAQGRPSKVGLRIDGGPTSDEQLHSYEWHGQRSVRWSLDKSRVLNSLHGTYDLAPAADAGTVATYQLAVSLKTPMLGVLKRRAEQVMVERALAGLKRRVESRGVAH
ncbi:MAG: cyclase [Actinophytocola sp.]|nr:cyclase [Actinophytocola sp.]